MSKYTTELRFICETLAGLKESVGYADTAHVIEQAAPIIFSFPFPIDDEAYRPVLERKIIRHYYTREISEETYGLWKLRLETKMNEIMPYYNKLYASERLEFNPLYDVDMTTTREGENHSDTTTTENSKDTTKTTANDSTTTEETDSNDRTIKRTESDSSNRTINRTENGTASDNKWDLYSDTPQGALSNVSNREYLTNARNNTDSASSNTTENTTDNASGSVTENTTDKASGTKNGTQEREGESNSTVNRESAGSGSIDSTDSYVLHVKGKQGGASYAKMIQEYRNALLNIDMMIIKDLAPLFFNLW